MERHRVVALVDMDCFYVQVEQRINPELKGKPCAVVQYNQWKGGGIIAVGYEARAHGVTRQMRGDEARSKCPEIQLVSVPNVRGKADLAKYREAGAEVIEVLSQFSKCVERASVDEAYIDLTEEVDKRLKDSPDILADQLPNTHVSGWEEEGEAEGEASDRRGASVSSWLHSIHTRQTVDWSENQRLAMGGIVAEEMRAAVYQQTGFRCSAGIAHNKCMGRVLQILAKLSCGLHKPNQQTILPHSCVQNIFQTLPIRKVRNLGGKFGASIMEDLQVETMGDLLKFSLSLLQEKYGDKNGLWVYEMCRGVDREPITARQLPKSIGCSKNFTGKANLDTKEAVKYWVDQLATEVLERLHKDKETNERVAKQLVVSVSYRTGASTSQHSSRSCALVQYPATPDKLSSDAYTLLTAFNQAPAGSTLWSPPIVNIGISSTKFIEVKTASSGSVAKFLCSGVSPSTQSASSSFTSTQSPSSLPSSSHSPSIQSTSSKVSSMKSLKSSKNALISMFSTMRDKQKENLDSVHKTDIERSENRVKDNEKDINGASVGKKKKTGFFASKRSQKGSLPASIFGSDSSDEFEEIKPKKKLNAKIKSVDQQTIQSANSNPAPSTSHHQERLEETELYQPSDQNEQNQVAIDVNEEKAHEKDSEQIKETEEIHEANETTDYNDSSDITMETNSVIGDVKRTASINPITSKNSTSSTNTTPLTSETLSSGFPLVLNSKSCATASSAVNTSSNSSPEDYVKCDKCEKQILVWDVPEHQDFHYAQDLMRKDSAIFRAQTGVVSSGKRKGGRGGGGMSKRAKNEATLHKFFGK